MGQWARCENDHPLDGARLLIVEDDFLIAVEIEALLSDAGAQIVGVCRSVKDALAVAEADELAGAILDMRVGLDSSAPVAHALKQRHIPFLFYTGQADMEPIRAEWPACKIISKPARAGAIIAAVAELLQPG